MASVQATARPFRTGAGTPAAVRRATGCATVSVAAGEQLTGTASWITSWLLIEQDGPWTADIRDRILADALDTAGLARLDDLWDNQGLRPLVIRRPAASARTLRSAHTPRRRQPRTVLVGHTRPDGGWVERLTLTDLRELRAIDLTAVAAGDPGHGTPVTDPVLLVCTHSAKDMCCAISGRPVAAALGVAYPDHTWETTHLGGDRFAGNLAVVPHGLFYGRLDASSAVRVAAEVLAGRVPLEAWRGRTLWDPPGQWAEAELRRHLGAQALPDVAVEDVVTHAAGEHTVTLRGPAQDRWLCHVSEVADAEVTNTCSGTTTTSAFVTRSLTRR